MKKKRYYLTTIYSGHTVDTTFESKEYQGAFDRAGWMLQFHTDAWGILIYSDQQTAIVLTRKNFPKLFPKT